MEINLPEHILKQIQAGIAPLDIIHGELKNLMYDAELELVEAQRVEDETEEAMDSMERKYWEGQCDALTFLYQLTYNLSFATPKQGTDRVFT